MKLSWVGSLADIHSADFGSLFSPALVADWNRKPRKLQPDYS